MKIMLGPVHRAIAVTPTCLIACHHATNFFTTASIVNADGSAYLQGWKKEIDAKGAVREVRATDFNFHQKSETADIDYCEPLAPVPVECLTPILSPAAGDDVIIDSVRLGQSINGRIEGIYGPRAVCDFPAQTGDSGSLVWSKARPGVFIGFIAAGASGKSTIALPNNDVISGRLPADQAPVVGAPGPTPPLVPVQPPPAVAPPVPTPVPVQPLPLVVPPAAVPVATDKAAAVRQAGEALAQAITAATDGRARSMALTQLELTLLIVGNAISPAPTLVSPQ